VASNALDNSTKDSIGHLLNIQARQFTIAQGQQELLSVEEIRIKPSCWTISCRPLIGLSSKMSGGALFADEVGLGKTIEIGMVLKEMDFRDTRDSFLF